MSFGHLLVALLIYAGIVLAIGWWSMRRAPRSPEEFFLAGRTLGTVVLFMALFGTNCTPFVLVGVPGQAYHDGIGIFSVNVPIIALGIPLTFYLIGVPARKWARRWKVLTPAELYATRFSSPNVGRLLFAFYTLYTIPYMVAGLKGAGLTLADVSGGRIPASVGVPAILGLALLYTTLGGMRATAWTNVLQGFLFLGFLWVLCTWIAKEEGGPSALMSTIQEKKPELLSIETGRFYSPAAWTSWGMAIALTVIAFPHMLVRLMAAQRERTLQKICLLYPLALVLVWLPAVLIGVWGAHLEPGLVGRDSDQIYGLMVARLPVALACVGLIAVLAALMSTLDAQILTLSSMLSRDVAGQSASPRLVQSARFFSLGIAVIVWILTMVWGRSVYDISIVAFSGYVTLTPTLLLAFRWHRFTAMGAAASILAGNAVLLVTHFNGWTPLGFLPVFWGLTASLLAAILGSLASPPPQPLDAIQPRSS